MTSMWMYERERFLRQMCLTVLSNSNVPEELNKVLAITTDKWSQLIDKNEKLRSLIDFNATDLTYEIADKLKSEYINLPIGDENKTMNYIATGVLEIVSSSSLESASGIEAEQNLTETEKGGINENDE